MTAPAGVTAANPPTSGTNAQSVKVTVAESPGTEYVILVKGDNGMWSSSTPLVTARSTESAIRKHAENGNREGTFIAIPARSFKAVTVVKQTVTTLKLEEAK